MRALGFLVVAAVLTTVFSCSDKESCTREVAQELIDAVDAAQLAIDNKIIDDYIASNSITGVEEVNGVKYVITKEGSGVTPCLENAVSVRYKGTFLSNGDTFDSNQINPIEFPLNQLVLGWRLTFPSFPKGTKATIFIPSGFGYGPSGFLPRIPANANLIFEIELVSVR